MRFMFRLTQNSLMNLKNYASAEHLFKKLLAVCYRLIVCAEYKDKQDKSVTPHLHGYIEMDGNKTDKQNMDKLRYILKHYSTEKGHHSIQLIHPKDEKATMAYVTKQSNVIGDYNTSYDIDSLKEWYKTKVQKDELAKTIKAKDFREKLIEHYLALDSPPFCLDELKIFVARELIDADLLPVMSKVRALTMYLVHKCSLTNIMDCELAKLL